MKQGGEITAERVLHLVRSRMIPEIPQEAAGIQSTSATRIVETFRADKVLKIYHALVAGRVVA